MSNRTILGIAGALMCISAAATVKADCTCLCVEGSVQAVCDNSVEPRPMCAPTWCAPPPDIREPEPSIASPGKQWLYTAPPKTRIGDDAYDWNEYGEEP